MAEHAELLDKQSQRVLRNPKALWGLIHDSVRAWIDDFASSMGAAISYYTVFSMAPLFLIAVGIAGLVFGREAAQGQIVEQLRGLMGEQGAGAIEALIRSTGGAAKGTLATLIGIVTLLLGATSVFAELQTDLDRIWRAPAAKRKEGIWNMVRGRVATFGMVGALGFLVLVSLLASAAISALGKWWAPLFGGMELLLQGVNFVVSLGLTALLFALVYKVLPRAKIGWHDVWVGSIATSILFAVGRFLIGLYIGKSTVVSGFGAAGSLAVVLVWVYYSAQIFLLGAEFTWVYAYRYGSRRGLTPPRPGREIPTHETPAIREEVRPSAPAPRSSAAAPRASVRSRHAAARD